VQCCLLSISRSSWYYTPKDEGSLNLKLKRFLHNAAFQEIKNKPPAFYNMTGGLLMLFNYVYCGNGTSLPFTVSLLFLNSPEDL
jgi:hypothetical protein